MHASTHSCTVFRWWKQCRLKHWYLPKHTTPHNGRPQSSHSRPWQHPVSLTSFWLVSQFRLFCAELWRYSLFRLNIVYSLITLQVRGHCRAIAVYLVTKLRPDILRIVTVFRQENEILYSPKRPGRLWGSEVTPHSSDLYFHPPIYVHGVRGSLGHNFPDRWSYVFLS